MNRLKKILQELLGLQSITDRNELKQAIDAKISSLNKMELYTLKLKAGMKAQELENIKQGLKPPTKKVKFITVILLFALSFFGFWLPLKYDLSLIFKIPIFIFASYWGLSGLRAVYRLFTGNGRK
jgi:hypothetical protein